MIPISERGNFVLFLINYVTFLLEDLTKREKNVCSIYLKESVEYPDKTRLEFNNLEETELQNS